MPVTSLCNWYVSNCYGWKAQEQGINQGNKQITVESAYKILLLQYYCKCIAEKQY
jgi:hypothetical protein